MNAALTAGARGVLLPKAAAALAKEANYAAENASSFIKILEKHRRYPQAENILAALKNRFPPAVVDELVGTKEIPSERLVDYCRLRNAAGRRLSPSQMRRVLRLAAVYSGLGVNESDVLTATLSVPHAKTSEVRAAIRACYEIGGNYKKLADATSAANELGLDERLLSTAIKSSAGLSGIPREAALTVKLFHASNDDVEAADAHGFLRKTLGLTRGRLVPWGYLALKDFDYADTGRHVVELMRSHAPDDAPYILVAAAHINTVTTLGGDRPLFVDWLENARAATKTALKLGASGNDLTYLYISASALKPIEITELWKKRHRGADLFYAAQTVMEYGAGGQQSPAAIAFKEGHHGEALLKRAADLSAGGGLLEKFTAAMSRLHPSRAEESIIERKQKLDVLLQETQMTITAVASIARMVEEIKKNMGKEWTA